MMRLLQAANGEGRNVPEHQPLASVTAANNDGPGTRSSNDSRAPGSSRISRRRAVAGSVLLLILSGVLGWQLYTSRDYWQTAWAEGRILPGELDLGAARPQVDLLPPRAAFDLSRTTVPVDEVFEGGPPKDGIPALSDPKLISARDATYVMPEDRVIGLALEEQARAYPLKILNYHEIVNDQIGQLPVVVSYCPLCDSAAAFDRRTPLGPREFGVSGLLYNSNVLMYDRGGRPESLWSQIKFEGISGPAAERSLTWLPFELTTWRDWVARHPKTKVLSPETGYHRDYRRNPYASYFKRSELMFPAKPTSDRLPTKARVLGVWTDNAARAYPESVFRRGINRVQDEVDGKRLVVQFNPDASSLRIVESDDGVRWMYSLWFAWYAFHPETSVFGTTDRENPTH